MPSQTGPTTIEGKARSARNATTHSLTCRAVLVPEQDRPAYDQLAQDLFAELKPETALESEHARALVDAYWRLRQIRTRIDVVLARDPENFEEPDSRLLGNLTLYEKRTERTIDKVSAEIKASQSARRQARNEALMQCADFNDFNRMLEKQSPPAESAKIHPERFEPVPLEWEGFVFSPADIDAGFKLRNRVMLVSAARRVGFDLKKYDEHSLQVLKAA